MDSTQQAAHDAIVRGENILLTGPGGTGKTFVVRNAMAQLSKLDRVVAVTATTGAAAVNLGLADAQTIDSFLGLRPNHFSIADYISDKLRHGKGGRFKLITVETLIVEEVSMLTPEKFRLMREILALERHLDIVEKIRNIPAESDYVSRERTITDICEAYRDRLSRESEAIQFVLLGDFHQLPYIPDTRKKGGDLPQIFDMPEWEQMKLQIYELSVIHRQRDPDMQAALNSIRKGQYTDNAQRFIRRSMQRVPGSHQYVHLFPKNDLRNEYNKKTLESLPGRTATLTAVDDLTKADDYHRVLFTQKVKLQKVVTVKVGCQVILLRNLSRSLINGSLGTLQSINPLVVRFFNGEEKEIKPQREDLYDTVFSEQIGRTIKMKFGSRTQYPLDLGYALTLHKAQGMTLTRVIVHLNPIFDAGAIYTALSRAQTEEGLIIQDCNIAELRKHQVPKAVTRFYKRGNRRQAFESVWVEMAQKIITGTTMRQLHNDYLCLDHPLRPKLLQQKRFLEAMVSLSVSELKLLEGLKALFGLKRSTSMNGHLSILCPLCTETITEQHLLLVGLCCTCGCPSKSLLDAVLEKYDWACYIIQEAGQELSGPVEYVGITTRGGARLSEQARHRFHNLRNFVIRCSLRLGETDLLQLFHPRSNVQLIGNAPASGENRLRPITNSRVSCVSLPVIYTMWRNRGKLIRHDSQAGLLCSMEEWRKLSDPKCHLKGKSTCEHRPRCFLREEDNKRKNREWHYPFREEDVEPKRQRREVLSLDGLAEETEWSVEAAIRIRNRGLVKDNTLRKNDANVRRLWGMGALRLTDEDKEWSPLHLAKWMGVVFPRSKLSYLIHELRALVMRMTLSERERFVCQDVQWWIKDRILFNYVGNGESVLVKLGKYWEV